MWENTGGNQWGRLILPDLKHDQWNSVESPPNRGKLELRKGGFHSTWEMITFN